MTAARCIESPRRAGKSACRKWLARYNAMTDREEAEAALEGLAAVMVGELLILDGQRRVAANAIRTPKKGP